MALRGYHVAVDFGERNVAVGRGGRTLFIDPPRNPSVGALWAAVPRQGGLLQSVLQSIATFEPARPSSCGRAPMGHATEYLKCCVIWRWAC